MTTVTDHVLRLAEERLQRELTPGERRVDWIANDQTLEAGKEQLAAAIDAELRRVIRDRLRGIPSTLRETPKMRAALVGLYRAGEASARREIREHGLRALAETVPPAALDGLRDALTTHLATISRRVDRESSGLIVGDLAGFSRSAVERHLLRRVPGARDAASRLVSGAFAQGLAGIYEANPGLFDAWEYSSVGDGRVCADCRSRDGRTYPTLEAAYVDLPNFGPNPYCYGDGRCRCRLVPAAVAPQEGIVPEPEPVAYRPTTSADAADAIVAGIHDFARRRGETPSQEDLDGARANWAKRLKDRMSTDEVAARVVDDAIAHNAQSAVHRATVEEHGADVVVLVRRAKTVDPVVDVNDHFAAHRLVIAQTTIIKDEAAAFAAGVPAAGAATTAEHGGTAAILRHEYAHSLWKTLPADEKDAFRRSLPATVKDDLTIYAASDPEEAWCELYAVVSDPAYDPAGWAKWIQDAGTRYHGAPRVPADAVSQTFHSPRDLLS